LGEYTFTYTYTDSIGCKTTAIETTSVHELPVVQLTLIDSTYCAADTLILISGEPVGGFFTGNGIVDSVFFNPSLAILGENELTYFYTDSFGCSSQAVDTTLVLPLPQITSGNDTSVCAGMAVQLFAEGGIGYSWSPVDALDDPLSDHPVATPLVTTTYTVTGFSSIGCSDTSTVTIAIQPPATALILGLDSSYCINDASVELVAEPSGGLFSGPGISGNTFDPSQALVGENVITYNYTDSVGCGAFAADTLLVNELPVVSFYGLNNSYCKNDSADELTGIPAGGEFSGSGMIFSTFYPYFAQIGSDTVTYVYTDSLGCSNSSIGITTVYELPALIISNDTAICIGQEVQLEVSGATSYLWWPTNGLSDSLSDHPLALPEISTQYNVTGTSAQGCSDTASVTITVNPLPEIYLGADTTICNNVPLILNAGSGFSSYLWSTGSPDSFIIVSTPDNYSVNVTDANGCVGSDTIVVMVDICDGVGEVKLMDDLTVYPNPVKNNLVVEFGSSLVGSVILDIVDLPGRIVYTRSDITENHLIVDVSNLSEGWYILRIAAKERSWIRQFSIVR
jgi:hypothetical protein